MFLICEECFERDALGPDRLICVGDMDYGTCEHCSESGDCLTVTTSDDNEDE